MNQEQKEALANVKSAVRDVGSAAVKLGKGIVHVVRENPTTGVLALSGVVFAPWYVTFGIVAACVAVEYVRTKF